MSRKNGKIVNCDNCGIEIYKPLNRIIRSKNYFCSPKCHDNFRLNKLVIPCHTCGKSIEIVPSRLKRSKNFFCSQECMTIGFTGVNHSGFFKNGNKGNKCINYKHGTQTVNGYICVLAPDHPYANARGYVYEHRLVVEKRIGRYLNAKEVVHHINFNKKDNRDENLMLFDTDEEHRKFHAKLRRNERLRNGFTSPKIRLQIYKTYKYQKWRELILSRDKQSCTLCGATEELHADHIKPVVIILKDNNIKSIQEAKSCNELWDVNNGRTLCGGCHRNTDTWGGNNH